ncbi:unnamed protein product [Pleuronectes platessa]|uniref:Uncharacterized protein n=1 Tax=Pleuronectes platessa TaxID=8262 RepID=A0A9N7URB2_PLEPL|nr:uncharacterized protein zgc:193726 [Pleuronectes platessa]CAB1434848.1 unnamed protein product [Pleuronectes platessa]
MKSVAVVVMMMMMMLSSAAPVHPSLNNSSLELHPLNATLMTGVGYGTSRFLRCSLPTCLTINLVSSLQTGDEAAGGAASDPFGIGKK